MDFKATAIHVMIGDVFQDWSANRGNVKGRLILIAFRLATLCAKVRYPVRFLLLPYVVFYRVVVEWVLGVELPWKLSVGAGLRLYHGQSLVINDRCVIGRDCIVRHSTTIGVSMTSADFDGDCPVIGDYVDIGSNVVIVGSIKIGNNVKIGAGSVVVADVEEGAVVVGNPARVIRSTGPSLVD